MPGMHNIREKKKKILYLTLLFKHAWNAQQTKKKKKKLYPTLLFEHAWNAQQTKKKKKTLPDAPL